MTMPRAEVETIQEAQQYDLIYAQLGYLYTILPDGPHSPSGDLLHLGHVMQRMVLLGLFNRTICICIPLEPMRTVIHGGASLPYAPPLVGCPLMPYSSPNPPQDTSHATSQVGASTSYTGPPMHQHVQGHPCSGAPSNPYSPFPSPLPTPPALLVTTPQPQVSVVFCILQLQNNFHGSDISFLLPLVAHTFALLLGFE